MDEPRILKLNDVKLLFDNLVLLFNKLEDKDLLVHYNIYVMYLTLHKKHSKCSIFSLLLFSMLICYVRVGCKHHQCFCFYVLGKILIWFTFINKLIIKITSILIVIVNSMSQQ